ncbi:MAG: phosphatase PAP2 family protein [Paludibacter sp.]|nr:phosphatase PAP2 family protein [Paludibacter sp.]MCM1576916.1 phosphatase PAP2 family protein [Bacteroides sp.]
MKDFFKNNWPFLTAFVVVFAIIGAVLLSYDKAAIHLVLNSFHTATGDFFLHYYTYVGEWVPYLVVFLLLFRNVGDSIFLLINLLLSGLVVQIVKHIVHAPRPAVFFNIADNPDVLPLVKGVHVAMNNSFPSGHTASFFALFLCLSCIFCAKPNTTHPTIKSFVSFLCFVLAALGAFSRIYLSQHFLMDIFAGGIIGTLCVTVVYGFWAHFNVPERPFCRYRLGFQRL